MITRAVTVAFLFLVVGPAGIRGEEPASRTLEGSRGWIGALAFTADGRALLSGGGDKMLRGWDVEKGREVELVPTGHTDAVSAVAANDEGFVSAGFDGTIRLMAGILNPVVLRDHKGAVLALSLSSKVKCIASGGVDGVVRIWDKPGDKPRTLTGHTSWVNALAFAPDHKLLASASSDNTVKLWDTQTWKEAATLDGKAAELRSLAWSPDGKSLAVGTRYGLVQIWDVANRKLKTTLKGHEADVWGVAWSPDGKTIASGNGDWNRPGQVKLWDAETGKERMTLKHSAEVLCVAFSPDGKWLAAGGWDGKVKLWQLGEAK